MVDYQRLRTDLLALAVLAGTVYLSLCLFSYDPADPPSTTVYPLRTEVHNIGGATGAWLVHTLLQTFGAGAYCLPIMLAVWDLRLFSREGTEDAGLRLFGAALVMTAIVVAVQVAPPLFASAPPVGNGGYAGASLTILLHRHFQPVGLAIVVVSLGLAGLVLANEVRLFYSAAQVCLLPFTMWDRLAFRYPVTEYAATVPEPVKPAALPVATAPIPIHHPPVIAPALERENTADLVKPELPATPVEPPIPTPAPEKPAAPVRSLSVLSLLFPTKVTEEPAEEAPSVPLPVVTANGIKINPPLGSTPVLGLVTDDDEDDSDYLLPSPQMLDGAAEFPYEVLAQKAQVAAQTLEQTFQQFGLKIRVSEIDTGPVVTQYELDLEPGLRLSKVTSLADDLAIALRVPSVRVVAPIPGKNTVGVEVPNDVRVMVRLRELIENCKADFEDKRLPLFLGKDVRGRPLVVDMCKMPHLLIAGRTGTGKSVCLNTLILSLLMTRSPEQVKMLMIDPKMVELSPYMRIPHLMHPVITDMKKAEAVLGWAVDKMEERYDLLARVGVRHLDSYNQLGREKVLQRLGLDPDSEEAESVPEQMPYIVIIADEMADMIMTSGKEVEGYIIRLAQKSRAVGIHLVLATQKPTVDVITGLIKSNLPARIAFQVSSRMDSRVVLDEQGAEKLLGNGDLLYLAPGTSHLTRAQGTFVSDDEVNRVIEHFADQEPQYSDEIVQVTTAAARAAQSKSGGSEARDRDDLYDQAVEVVIREGRGSVSLLQRALGVGYGRGARMIDWMAEDGIVGTYNGSQAREVVMTIDEWESRKSM
ncbi:DNA translocase FtsK [bacterium]|nr:DNA translocase FtsK [bacterium]